MTAGFTLKNCEVMSVRVKLSNINYYIFLIHLVNQSQRLNMRTGYGNTALARSCARAR